MTDALRRFIFDGQDIRGEHIQLSDSYRDILCHHHYPPAVAALLGQFIAAAGLLSATIKFQGRLILQVRGDGQVPLIMAEAHSDGGLRAIARDAEAALSTDFRSLLGEGQLAITIDPDKGKRYQGIVSLAGDNLAQCLESYFFQSEQLRTRLWLHSDGERAGGLLLQELPAHRPAPETWQHVCTLADTVRGEELTGLTAEELLHRLYHQEALRLFDSKALRFQCTCSRKRIEEGLRSLGAKELYDILAEQGSIETHCEFCHRHYRFDSNDIDGWFAQTDSPTHH